MKKILVAALLPVFTMLLPWDAIAGNYGVSPLSLSYSPQQKTGVVTVTNEDKKPLAIRLRAMKWTQDADGNDQYVDTDELVFFPKRLDMKPGDKKVVRVGVKSVPEATESAYRLYLEELPPAQTEQSGETKLAVLVTFGLPVFSGPADARAETRLAGIKAGADGISFSVTNNGNAHERLSRIVADDGQVITENLPGRYIFAGKTKTFSAALPAEMCDGRERRIRIESESGVIETPLTMPASCGN